MSKRRRHPGAGFAIAGKVGKDREENMTMHSRLASDIRADDRQAGDCHKTVLFPSFQGRRPRAMPTAARLFAARIRAAKPYWTSSSAPASRFGGTSRPSVLAVLMLMISSNLDDDKTGRSAARAPWRIQPV